MLRDRIKVSTDTTGTGTLTLGAADKGFQGFDSLTSEQTYYAITNSNNWEVGLGSYSSGLLTRDEVYDSSSSGNLIDLIGKSTVFVTYPADKAVYLNPSYSPSTNDFLIKSDSGWTGRPISSGDVVSAIGYLPPSSQNVYFGGSGIQLAGNVFSLGGTGTLDTLHFGNNIKIGTGILSIQVVEGTGNVYIGNLAGHAGGGGSGNVFIGQGAGYGIRGNSNNIEIRSSGSLSSFVSRNYSNRLLINNLIAGDFSSKYLTVGKVCTNESLSLYISNSATLEVIPSSSGDVPFLVKDSNSQNIFRVGPAGTVSGVSFATSGGLSMNSGIPASTSNRLYTDEKTVFWDGMDLLGKNIVDVSGSYQAQYLNETVLLHSGTVSIAPIQLLSPGTKHIGTTITIKATNDNVTISPLLVAGGFPPSLKECKIDGSNSSITMKKYDCIKLLCGPSEWHIISKYSTYVDGNI